MSRVSRWDVELPRWMTRIWYSSVLQDTLTDAGPSGVPPTVDMSVLARVNEAGAKTISFLRAQLASLEQKVKHVQGVSDIAADRKSVV